MPGSTPTTGRSTASNRGLESTILRMEASYAATYAHASTEEVSSSTHSMRQTETTRRTLYRTPIPITPTSSTRGLSQCMSARAQSSYMRVLLITSFFARRLGVGKLFPSPPRSRRQFRRSRAPVSRFLRSPLSALTLKQQQQEVTPLSLPFVLLSCVLILDHLQR